jgi:ABC-type glycerol-3-phosphate transport system permease component
MRTKNKKRSWKRYLLLLVLILVAIITVLPFFLTMHRKVNAPILIIEGWMPVPSLEAALDEFRRGDYQKIIVTGHHVEPSVLMSIRSYLIFYPPFAPTPDSVPAIHRFQVHAQSTLGPADSALFALWINDNKLAEFYTADFDEYVSLEWEGRLQDIDSLMIQYINDQVTQAGDRNLMIKDVEINNISLLTQNSTRIIDRGRPFGEHRRNLTATTHAELATYYLLSQGVDPDQIISVNNLFVDKRRTYGNALSLKYWFQEQGFESAAVNIVSTNYHSRRTWLTYKRLLGSNFDVGIISVENIYKEKSVPVKAFHMFRETAALIYYVVFILPWV